MKKKKLSFHRFLQFFRTYIFHDKFKTKTIYHFNIENRFLSIFLSSLFNTFHLITSLFLKLLIIFTYCAEQLFFKNFIFFQTIKKKKNNQKKPTLHVIGNRMRFNSKLIKSNDHLFCVNLFFYNDLKNKFFSKYIKQIKFHIVIHQPKEYLNNNKKYFDGLVNYVCNNQNIYFFLNSDWKKIKAFKNCKNIKFFNLSGLQLFYYKMFMLDQTKLLPSFSNILQACIFIGIRLNYKKIFLHSYDLNFTLYEKYYYTFSKKNKKQINFSGTNYFFTDIKTRDWQTLINYSKFKRVKLIKDDKTTFFPLI